jgi:RHS repeat-associated protein
VCSASLNTTFSYDGTGKLTSRTLPNSVVTTPQYDGLDRLTKLTHAKTGNTFADFQYQFNAVGNITQMTDGAGAHNYSYDPLDRLTAATHPNQTNENYTFDDVGNRTASHQGSSYSYQAFNRLVTANSNTYGYNANGNLVSKTDASGSWSYTWDYENRLKQASKSGGVTVTYAYDGLGRRVQRTSNAGGTTKFVYDGADVVRDLDGSGNTVADYLNGPGIDNKLRQAAGGVVSYFASDHLGTTRALTDASGSLTSTLNYDSFGNVTSGSAPSRYTYTGREADSDTGLMFYRARWYDPQVGRFINEDPIELRGGTNFYTYVNNNPVNSSDPLGLFTVRDNITQRRAVDIDAQCGSSTGGACTRVAALVVCTCKCDGANWKASAELRIYGQMWIYNGPFPYKRRRPVDRTVVNAETAIAHEYNAHINPSIAAVTPLINALEARTFKSKEECYGACGETSGQVSDLFRRTLRRTQEQENR